MKNIILASLLFLAACSDATEKETVSSTTDTTVIPSTPPSLPERDTVLTDESNITSIRSRVESINNQKLLVQTFNWGEPSCADVGTIRYFLNGDEIVKVIETGFVGDGGWTKEYYYDKGRFIFSY